MRTLSYLFLVACSLLLASCADPMVQQQIDARRMAIAAEPRGDYFIGRRFFIERTQFWGYLRRPGQSWDSARLVMMNESRKLTPDRVSEVPTDGGPARGYDHNREYRIYGYFSGQKVYDPNSDLIMPEFVLTNYEVLNESPGWLFNPKEKYDGAHLLRVERNE
jgi:hypothetical protein